METLGRRRTCTTSEPVSTYTHESPTFAQTSSQPTSATTDAVVPDSYMTMQSISVAATELLQREQ